MTAEVEEIDDYTEAERKEIGELLDAAGWKVTSVADLLGLTPEESALVEVRVSLSRALRMRREAAGLTQTDLAKKIGSSQSRIGYAEAANKSVSLDLMIRAFLATGATQNDLARALAV